MIRLGSVVTIIFLLTTSIFSQVVVEFFPKVIVKGEQAEFRITTDKQNTIFPQIDEIGGSPVLTTRSSFRSSSVNGKEQLSNTKSYIVAPSKSIKSEVFLVTVNGVNHKTKVVDLKVQKPTQTNTENFKFEITASKNQVYVGEELEIEAIFTATSKVNLSGLSFDPENIEGFTVKNLQSQWLGQRLGEKNRFKRKFTVVPQKSGNMKIDGQPLVAQFQNGRSMFATTSSKRFYSNKLQINVKPLPKGVSVVGDFEIESKIDKQEVKEGEAVTVTYTIFGFGSLDGLDFGEPSVEGVTVYKDKETIKNSFQNERLYSVFKVKIAYLSGDDFAIPKKSIKFFDPKKKKIVSKFTKPYQIKVKKISKKIKRDKPEIVQKKEKNQEIKEKDEKNIELEKYYFLIYGLIVGIIIGFFINFKREKKSRDNNFTLNFSKFKFSNKKELYNKLLPHVDNPEVKEMVQRLENHLYRGDNSDIKGSEIKKLLKKIMGK